jgi:peptidoglycan/xylan/chitin deacetylase (PgdA/CDA1 family)
MLAPTPLKEALWPQSARIAVVVTVVVENWSEGKAPAYSPMTTSPPPGIVDRANISWSEYGGRAGAWRLLRILSDHGVPSTFCVNARSAELHPELMRQIVTSGHEVAAHAYYQDKILSTMTPSEEREVIRQCAQVLEKTAGVRPSGWISPTMAITEHTADLLAAEGYLWHGDYNSIDLPCRITTKNGAIVALPHSDFADNRVLRAAPRDFYQCYKDTFDYLYAKEPSSYLNITLHGHFGGRPLISAVFDQILAYIKEKPAVWLVRHDELARWVMARELKEFSYRERFFSHAAR